MSIKILRKLSKRPNKDSAYPHGAGDMLPCDVRFVRTIHRLHSQANRNLWKNLRSPLPCGIQKMGQSVRL